MTDKEPSERLKRMAEEARKRFELEDKQRRAREEAQIRKWEKKNKK